MPNATRESIYAALFALTNVGAPLATRSRRVQHFTTVAPTDQPAVFQQQVSESVVTRKDMPSIRVFRVDWLIYAYNGEDPTVIASTQLNTLVDLLEEALLPPAGQEAQTLGGKVQRVYLAGDVEYSEGPNGPQAIAVMPLEIIVPYGFECTE